MNEWLLDGHGTVETEEPERDAAGGIKGKWTLTWNKLEAAIKVHTGEPLQPVTIDVVYASHWNHGHIARLHAGLQGSNSMADAGAHSGGHSTAEPILRAIVESEVHERVYQTDGSWRLVKEA